jgi:hypothetical protein
MENFMGKSWESGKNHGKIMGQYVFSPINGSL